MGEFVVHYLWFLHFFLFPRQKSNYNWEKITRGGNHSIGNRCCHLHQTDNTDLQQQHYKYSCSSTASTHISQVFCLFYYIYMQLLADDPIGTRVLQVNAYDVDRGSSLRYSIVPGSYSARDPFNRDVLSTAQFDYTVSMVRSWCKEFCLLCLARDSLLYWEF